MDIATLAFMKKYVQASLEGAGALKGEQGLSAYEVAVNSGFVGSESEWLASLKGDSPYIGKDGNWYIGNENTGVAATPTVSYETLTDIPTVNGVEVSGDLELSDIGIDEMTEEDVDNLFQKGS